MRVTLHPEAKTEFLDAVEFYANESVSAANRFIAEFEETARIIGLYPNRYRKIRRLSHIKEFPSFPYSLLYHIIGDIVKIDAIAHDKRKPGYWKKRT